MKGAIKLACVHKASLGAAVFFSGGRRGEGAAGAFRSEVSKPIFLESSRAWKVVVAGPFSHKRPVGVALGL